MSLKPPSLDAIEAAAARLKGRIVRTPLVRLSAPGLDAEIHVKLENLQPGGSFKVRPALNALLSADPEALRAGVYTASAGNMAQGLARGAKALGVRLRVYAPDNTARVKIEALQAWGVDTVLLPFDDWWRVLTERRREGEQGLFIHPAADPAVMAGDATVGLEILQDLPDVDAILTPYGGGGLTSGVASAAKAIRPQVKVFACESDAGTPVAAALEAGGPVKVDFKGDSFLMGIGGTSVLPEMWPIVSGLIDGAVCVTRDEIADAVRLGYQLTRTVMEAAGAATIAAALKGLAGSGKVACVISGGNVDPETFSTVLAGKTP